MRKGEQALLHGERPEAVRNREDVHVVLEGKLRGLKTTHPALK